MANLVPLSNKQTVCKLVLTASGKGKYAAIADILASTAKGMLSNDQVTKIQGLIGSVSADLTQREKIDLNNKLSLVLDPKVRGFDIPSDVIQLALTFLSPKEIVQCRRIHRNFNVEVPFALQLQLSTKKTYDADRQPIHMKELGLSADEVVAFPSRIEVLDFSNGVCEKDIPFLEKKHAGTVTHLLCQKWVDQTFLDDRGKVLSKVVHLELISCKYIRSINFDSLGKYWPNLKYLSLAGSYMAGDREISSITKNWKKLEGLDLCNIQVTLTSAKTIGENCPQLKLIHLSGNDSHLILEKLAPKCPLLRTAVLYGSYFPSLKELASLQGHCPSLENLSLQGCLNKDYSPCEDQIIYILDHFKSLKHLDINRCQISVKIFMAIVNRRPGINVKFWLTAPQEPATSTVGVLYNTVLMAIWRKRADPQIPRLFEKISPIMQDLIKHYLGKKNIVKRIDEIGISDLPVFLEILILALKNTCDEKILEDDMENLSLFMDRSESSL